MSRIRTIKPEFPQSESMGRISRDARLLFVLIWTLCDDSGRTRAASRVLASLLFPYDDDAKDLIDVWLAELEGQGCIMFYQVDGTKYLEVCKWASHQKIDRPSGAKCPAPREPSRVPIEGSSEDLDRDLGSRNRTGTGTSPRACLTRVLGGQQHEQPAETDAPMPPAGRPRPAIARTDDDLLPGFRAYCVGAQQDLSWGAKYLLPAEQIFAFGKPPDVIQQVAAHYRGACDNGRAPSLVRFASDVDRWHAEWQHAQTDERARGSTDLASSNAAVLKRLAGGAR